MHLFETLITENSVKDVWLSSQNTNLNILDPLDSGSSVVL